MHSLEFSSRAEPPVICDGQRECRHRSDRALRGSSRQQGDRKHEDLQLIVGSGNSTNLIGTRQLRL